MRLSLSAGAVAAVLCLGGGLAVPARAAHSPGPYHARITYSAGGVPHITADGFDAGVAADGGLDRARAAARRIAADRDREVAGSNGIAVGSAGVRAGSRVRGLLYGNPHMAWTGSERF